MPPESPQDQVVTVLECVECGEQDAEACRWRAYYSREVGLLVYCPECAEREFGE